MRLSAILTLLVILLLLAGCPVPPAPVPVTPTPTPVLEPPELAPTGRYGLINLAHLDYLTEPVVIDGRLMALVHIYAEAPDYQWVSAPDEGISAVDDVARAALVYLEVYARYGDDAALERARLLLEFVMHMQADDGEYYNFVLHREGTINRDGRTSYKDWGWWAARGQWALARGYRVFSAVDPEFAARLRDHYLRGEQALHRVISNVGIYSELHGVRIPAWLLKGGSDVSSVALLGLVEFYEAEPNRHTQRLIFELGQGIAEYRLGSSDVYPFGMHPSTVNSTAYWHTWGSRQVQALAKAGKVMGRSDWIASARNAADTWFTRMLATDVVREMGVIPRRFDQIAYAQNVIVSGYWNLYAAMGDERYARLAGLAASWFFGNNAAQILMYDPETGRGYDGIDGPTAFRVNFNAGAESTIEALWALLQVADDPIASRYMQAEWVDHIPWMVVEAEWGEAVAGDPRYGMQEWTGEAYFSNGRYYALGAGDVVEVTWRVPQSGLYDVYVAHMRQAPVARDLRVEAVRAPGPFTVDADLSEWEDAQPVAVDGPENILRGAGAWPGPDEGSFVAYFMWDEENLYVAAEVRDPEHVQTEVGPGVWRGDALWLYFDTTGRGQRIDVKLTLAQTPAGPQVWNWVSNSFLPDAELAWRQVEGGYVYEAALPLASLNFLEAKPGREIRFEVGMGFRGAFLTWSGADPDTPANLAPLVFVEELSPGRDQVRAAYTGADAVALSVQLDDGEPVVLPQMISPDRDYLWLDRLWAGVELEAGVEYRLTFTYAGANPEGETIVDAFLIHPVIARKMSRLLDGTEVVILYNAHSGEMEWVGE